MERWRGNTDCDEIEELLDTITGDMAYDIGANIGMTSQKLAKNFRSVVAFEPCKESFDILRTEVPANVLTKQVAVSDRDGTIELQEAMRSIQTGQLVSKPGLHWGTITKARTVQSSTLDEQIKRHGIPDFIKVDTEGHETEVIRGGVDSLRKFSPRLLIEIHHAHAHKEIQDLLPFYDLVKVEQVRLREESPIRLNHFWLLGGIPWPAQKDAVLTSAATGSQ